jgi:hypothetical protein
LRKKKEKQEEHSEVLGKVYGFENMKKERCLRRK